MYFSYILTSTSCIDFKKVSRSNLENSKYEFKRKKLNHFNSLPNFENNLNNLYNHNISLSLPRDINLKNKTSLHFPIHALSSSVALNLINKTDKTSIRNKSNSSTIQYSSNDEDNSSTINSILQNKDENNNKKFDNHNIKTNKIFKPTNSYSPLRKKSLINTLIKSNYNSIINNQSKSCELEFYHDNGLSFDNYIHSCSTLNISPQNLASIKENNIHSMETDSLASGKIEKKEMKRKKKSLLKKKKIL